MDSSANSHPETNILSKYKLVILIDSFFPITGGGERQMEGLGKALIKHGVDVCVVTRKYAGMPARDNLAGLPVYRLSFPVSFPVSYSGQSMIHRLLREVNAVGFILAVLKFFSSPSNTKQIILVQAGLSQKRNKLSVLAALIRKFARHKRLVIKPWNRPWIGGRQWMPDLSALRTSEERKSKLSSSLFAFIRNHTDRFVAISDPIYSALIVDGVIPDKVVKISNGVDTHKFEPLSAVEKERIKVSLHLSGKDVVTYMGTLKQQKGVNVLLDAWKQVSRLNQNAHLLMVGRTDPKSEFEYLTALIKELGIDDKVSFTGEILDVRPYLHGTDVFVLPSFLEGFSNAMLEAMSCGLPVIVTDISGVREAITPGVNGILVQPGDSDELAASLLKVLADKEAATLLGKAARKTVIELFSFDQISVRYLDLFENMM